jgi:hypothetical protein
VPCDGAVPYVGEEGRGAANTEVEVEAVVQ